MAQVFKLEVLMTVSFLNLKSIKLTTNKIHSFQFKARSSITGLIEFKYSEEVCSGNKEEAYVYLVSDEIGEIPSFGTTFLITHGPTQLAQGIILSVIGWVERQNNPSSK